jgi:hypothetical protein
MGRGEYLLFASWQHVFHHHLHPGGAENEKPPLAHGNTTQDRGAAAGKKVRARDINAAMERRGRGRKMWNEDNKEGNHWRLLEIKVDGIRRMGWDWVLTPTKAL